MKTINVTFEDEEYEQIIKIKGKTPWRSFLINLISNERSTPLEVPKP